MFVLGGLEDQITSIVWGLISSSPFSLDNTALLQHLPYYVHFEPFIHPLSTNQPILWFFISIILSIFGTGIYNSLVVLTILATLLTSYRYFKKYNWPYAYSLIFTFSAYTWSHLGRHIAISQLWLIPVYFILFEKLEKEVKFKTILISGLFLAICVLISNYLGFFLLLFSFIHIVCKEFYYLFFKKAYNFKLLKNYFLTFLFGAIFSVPFLLPFLRATYFSSTTVSNVVPISRGIEDFVTFSVRPWYFVAPPIKNPFIGVVGSKVVTAAEKTGYFLADDYFAGEHSGLFFGYTFLTLLGCGSFILLKTGKTALKRKVYFYYLQVLIVLSFMLPPFFTISGVKVLTPGYLVYLLFPMFRVTSRMAPIVLFLLLIIFAEIISHLYYKLSKKKLLMSVVFVVAVTLAEVFVPVKVFNYSNTPEVYTALSELPPEESYFAVYPYSESDEAFFWLWQHKRLLINPRFYSTATFDSETFTKNLATDQGLQSLSAYSNAYLVVIKEKTEVSTLDFFESSNKLKKIKETATYSIYKTNVSN
ncbi:MAG: hypothetical protein ACOZAO_03195 [Patescibacteria group bacterium]